jgi:hypothetical protein
MRAWRRLARLVRHVARAARRAGRALGPAGQALGERLAYRPREVVVVALLCGGLFGGLLVERWRARHPETADRLEAEPPRPTAVAAAPLAPRPRPRAAAPRCDPGGGRRTADAGSAGASRPQLDLNRATPRQLARLAGISWSLAARIVAARDALEGRDAGMGFEPPGPERRAYRRRPPPGPAGEAAPEADTPAAPVAPVAPVAMDPMAGPEPGSGEGAPDAAPADTAPE